MHQRLKALTEGARDTVLAVRDEAADGDHAFRFAFETFAHDAKGTVFVRVHTV
jgi:hypothetical protein